MAPRGQDDPLLALALCRHDSAPYPPSRFADAAGREYEVWHCATPGCPAVTIQVVGQAWGWPLRFDPLYGFVLTPEGERRLRLQEARVTAGAR